MSAPYYDYSYEKWELKQQNSYSRNASLRTQKDITYTYFSSEYRGPQLQLRRQKWRLHNGVSSFLTHLGRDIMPALQVISRFMKSVLKLTGTQWVDRNSPLKPVRILPAVI